MPKQGTGNKVGQQNALTPGLNRAVLNGVNQYLNGQPMPKDGLTCAAVVLGEGTSPTETGLATVQNALDGQAYMVTSVDPATISPQQQDHILSRATEENLKRAIGKDGGVAICSPNAPFSTPN